MSKSLGVLGVGVLETHVLTTVESIVCYCVDALKNIQEYKLSPKIPEHKNVLGKNIIQINSFN